VRGVAKEGLAFGEALEDKPDLILLQVAEAPVDELGGLRRRARGEIALVDDRSAKAPRRGVEGNACPCDAAADDQDVELLLAQPAESLTPVEPIP
jgi:hypothetical protein